MEGKNLLSGLSENNIAVSSLELRTLNPETFLYTELIKCHLGERASLVLSILLNKGRMSARELTEKIPDLSLKNIKSILVTLIQLRCVRYFEETALSGRKTVYYYFNEDGILLMLYAGDIIQSVEEFFQSIDPYGIATQIVQNVLALGSVTTKDYLQSITDDQSGNQVSFIFVKLCEIGFLTPLTSIHYIPIQDLWKQLYDKEYKSIPRTSTLSDLKKRNEAKAKAKVQFNNLLKGKDIASIITVDSKTSLRKISDSIPLTFNLERFLKARRSKHLVEFSKVRVGKTPSLIYETALRVTETHAPSLNDPLFKTGLLQDLEEKNSIWEDLANDEQNLPGVSFNAIDLVRNLPSSVDLRGTLTNKQKQKKRTTTQNQSESSKRIKTEDGFLLSQLSTANNGDLDSIDDEDDECIDLDLDFNEDDSDPHSISLISAHLKLLSTSQIPFIKESKPGLYFIPYTILIPMLKSYVYDSLIASTLGASAHRILRCIRDNNLVTEKVINNTALMKEKDIRTVIANLVRYNAIEIQEVPRTVDRSASRSVFLFRTNQYHAYAFLKQNLMWNIANLLHKIENLKEENFTLLTKANRDDVKGNEIELLLPSELNQLKMVNDRELNASVRKARLLFIWEVFELF